MVPSVRHFFFFFTLAWRVSRSTARGVGPPGGGGVFSCSPRWGPQLGFDHAGPGLRGLLSGVTNSLFSATALRTLPNFDDFFFFKGTFGPVQESHRRCWPCSEGRPRSVCVCDDAPAQRSTQHACSQFFRCTGRAPYGTPANLSQ